jgi:hypothetical protein
MKIICHITDRVLFTWPAVYWSELLGELVKDKHDVFIFSDDKHINIDIKHELIHKCFNRTDDEIDLITRHCDIFVGVPLRFSEIAKKYNKKLINILGATLKGEGIISPIVCAGCLDKGVSEIDCSFGDELCYFRITPIMVYEEIKKLCI